MPSRQAAARSSRAHFWNCLIPFYVPSLNSFRKVLVVQTVGRRTPCELFLFLRSCLLSRSLLGGLLRWSLLGLGFCFALASGFRLGSFYLFLLGSFLLQHRGAELLPFKSDLGNTHRGEVLTVSAHFLVLLL